MILVSGGSGLLGSHVLLAATSRGTEALGINLRPADVSDSAVTVQADLTDGAQARRLIREYRPSWVVHCAALTSVDLCEREPTEAARVNVDLTAQLAAFVAEVDGRLLYISTDSVFDGAEGGYSEEDTPAPVNVYARTKLAGEDAVLSVSGANLVIRTNFFGWSQTRRVGLANWVVSRLEAAQPVAGFTDVHFTPLLVNDLSELILDMVHLELRGIYHVAGSLRCNKFQFARDLATKFGFPPDLVQPSSIADSALFAPRPRDTSLLTAKVSRDLGRSMPDFRSGLSRLRELHDERS